MRCEECRTTGQNRGHAYKHRLSDGQRVTLCMSHARTWRIQSTYGWPFPLPYGPDAKRAHAAGAITEQLSNETTAQTESTK